MENLRQFLPCLKAEDSLPKQVEKPNKFEDFKIFVKQYPDLTTRQMAGAYGVSDGTIRSWLRKMSEK